MSSTVAALVNFVLYAGLTLVGGAVTVRYLLLTRCGLSATERAPAAGDAARHGAIGAALVLLAAPARALVQAAALADPGDVWFPLLRTIILETGLGRSLQLQTIWAAAALMAFSVARLGRQRGWSAAAMSTFVLALVPALSGHAAAAEHALLAQVATTLHVIGAGAWIGALFLIWRSARKASDLTLTRLLQAFHAVALGAVAMIAVSGAVQAWSILDAPAQLISTAWGRFLISKLVVLGGVAWLGYRHWRGAEQQVGAGDRTTLRRSMGQEIALAVFVLAITGALTSVGIE